MANGNTLNVRRKFTHLPSVSVFLHFGYNSVVSNVKAELNERKKERATHIQFHIISNSSVCHNVFEKVPQPKDE